MEALILFSGMFAVIIYFIVSICKINRFHKDTSGRYTSRLTGYDEAFVDELAQKIAKYNNK